MLCIGASFTSPGGREYNEDTVLIRPPEREDGLFLALAADGLGAHGGGDVASQTAAAAIAAALPEKAPLTPGLVGKAFTGANRAVLEKQTQNVKMKTTAALFAASKEGLILAHIGDTRIYHFRGGRLLYRSVDHSVAQAAVALGEITEAQLRFHPDRSRLVRALGARETADPHILAVGRPPDGQDTFLLCTDGFWEYVFEEEMLVDLCKADSPASWLSLMLCRIGSRAAGGNDNLSAVALFGVG